MGVEGRVGGGFVQGVRHLAGDFCGGFGHGHGELAGAFGHCGHGFRRFAGRGCLVGRCLGLWPLAGVLGRYVRLLGRARPLGWSGPAE
ncbi:hypothetical protein PL81_41215 [Streptomyces sp. RSD-27]|nr:hypothetical protein PL81_41215 [Streptomyces sp. RSD-27]